MRIRFESQAVLDTDLATKCWEERLCEAGGKLISRATGTWWVHETMYESSKGRYYIVRAYDNPGAEPTVRFVSKQEAAAWLAANGYDLEAEGFGECAAQVLE